MSLPKIAYLSFDIVPAPKGAAIHIAAFTQALAAEFSQIELLTVSPTLQIIEPHEIWKDVMQTELPAVGKTLIDRVLYFRIFLKNWLKNRWFDVIHVRSIYEGFPIALNKQKFCKYLIFEVNGLPSIELKYRYPAVAQDRELLHKLIAQEQVCLEAADLIVTPSYITQLYLQNRGISAKKIKVIPNGVDLEIFQVSPNFPLQIPDSNHPLKMIYFGTFSAWQGINLAVEALGLIDQEVAAELTIIGHSRPQQIQDLKKFANKLNINHQLIILDAVSQSKLVELIHTSDVIVAPLTPNDRNLVQGCCPLKVLEGMAIGIPVISSDLPAVRELGENEVHFLLVKPGSAKAIKEAIMRIKNEPNLAMTLAKNARLQIENAYTWQQSATTLIQAYKTMLS
jgi:glycosyltransferase involved in cell wall biosynthesis